MENKDVFLITIAFLGWSWGIIQFIINRRNQKKDKIVDRKYEAYFNYMKKSDQIMNDIRTDPNMIYGITSEFMNIVMTGDVDQINDATIQYNKRLIDFVKKATDPLLIVKQELNSLLIICSYELSVKVEELIRLTTEFNDVMQKSLNLSSPRDTNSIVQQFGNLQIDNVLQRYTNLNKEIIKLMRKEILNN